MPRPPQPIEPITLDLSGSKIDAAKFRRAVLAFLDLIENVANEVTAERGAVRWLITVEPGSVRLNATPEAAKPQVRPNRITHAIRSGIRLIETRAERPRFFSDHALERVREIATIPDGREMESARIKVATRVLLVSKRAASHVEKMLGDHVTDFGSVEGQLRMISIQGSNHFAVYDSLTDRAIRCYIDESRLDDVHRLWRQRVTVSGRLRYRKTGEPVSIEVDDIRGFPERGRLPTADDVYGIFQKAQ